ncbi:MAG: hypothetical protein LUD22_04255 [Coprobacillus sp.]|nr:hypothetical protein [Coprobacillus sp.]
MISERLEKVYGREVPIFSEEILNEYPNYSRVYVFRKLKEEVESGSIKQYVRGVYYIANRKNPYSTINAYKIMEKKYVGTKKNPIGVYSGAFLKNQFYVSRNVAAVREIVSNNESSKRREIEINKTKFVVSKSRVTITKENVNQYTLLELFSKTKEEEFNERSLEYVKDFMKKEKVSKKSLLIMSKYFPDKAIVNMIKLGVV